MTTWDLNTLLGAKLDDAMRVVLLHERSRSFRPFGLVELLLKILAAVILIPFWIYLLLSSMTLAGEGGDSGGGESGADASRARRRYSVSSLFDYHHDLVLRVFGKDGVQLHEARARVAHADEGRRLVASVLRAAQATGLVVVESVAEAGQGFHDPVHFWYGGRPLMARPELRPLEEIEERLRSRGFEILREDGRHTLRRVLPPPHLFLSLVMLGIVGYVAFLSASLWLLPAVLFALFLLRRQLGEFLLVMVSGLCGWKERHELSVTGSEVAYRGEKGWRRSRAQIAAGDLLAVACYGTLSWDDGVQRERRRLHLVGASSTLALPEALTDETQHLVADWVTAKLLAAREGLSVVALRSRCTYCGVLVDFGASPGCPECGAPFLGKTG